MPDSDDEFRATIAEDLTDLDRQRVYADFLEESGDELAEYIRLWADIQAKPEADDKLFALHLRRARMIKANAELWQWDNFLALRHQDKYIRQVEELVEAHSRHLEVLRADESDVRRLEELLNTHLPIGYREYVTKVADSTTVSGPHPGLEGVFVSSVTEVVRGLEADPGYLQRARSPAANDWKQGFESQATKYPRVVDVDRDHSWEETETGFVLLGSFPWLGTSYGMLINAEMSGVLVEDFDGLHYCATDWDDANMQREDAERIRQPEASGPLEVQRLPLDTFSAMHCMFVGYLRHS